MKMSAVIYTCEFQGCTWKLETNNMEQYIILLKIHVDARHKQKIVPEKVKRPEITANVSNEDWEYFTTRWSQYKKAMYLTGEDIVTQLLECCNEQLRRNHYRAFPWVLEIADEDTVLIQLKLIAVCQKTVNRVKLRTLKQGLGEPVRNFASKIKSLATNCSFTIRCTQVGCNSIISYQEAMITDQLINGLANTKIQKDVLSKANNMDLETLLNYIEGRESALAIQGLTYVDTNDELAMDHEDQTHTPQKEHKIPASSLKTSRKKKNKPKHCR